MTSRRHVVALRVPHRGLSELEEAGRIVRVRTRRGVWFMVPDDAADLITEAQEMIDYHRTPA
jgi:hypothetical protein